MQFNSNSTEQDIVTMSEELVKSNSVRFPITKKVMYANQAMRFIMSWIHEAFGGWIYDDSNQTNLPEGTIALVANQDTYTLPVDNSYIQGVSVKQLNGTWYKLNPINLEQIQDTGTSESAFLTTAGQPMHYRLLGNVVKIYPSASYGQDNSLKIHETRDVSSFTTTDTTKTPGFDLRYHEAVPTFMALQYAKINGSKNLKELQRDWDGDEAMTGREGGYKKMIKSDYSRRYAELFPARITVRDATIDYK